MLKNISKMIPAGSVVSSEAHTILSEVLYSNEYKVLSYVSDIQSSLLYQELYESISVLSNEDFLKYCKYVDVDVDKLNSEDFSDITGFSPEEIACLSKFVVFSHEAIREYVDKKGFQTLTEDFWINVVRYYDVQDFLELKKFMSESGYHKFSTSWYFGVCGTNLEKMDLVSLYESVDREEIDLFLYNLSKCIDLNREFFNILLSVSDDDKKKYLSAFIKVNNEGLF